MAWADGIMQLPISKMKKVQGKQGWQQKFQVHVGKWKGDGEEVTGYTDRESPGSPGWRYKHKSCSEAGGTESQGAGGSPGTAPR